MPKRAVNHWPSSSRMQARPGLPWPQAADPCQMAQLHFFAPRQSVGRGGEGPPGGRKLLQVRPGCGVVRGGRVMGGNGVPWERAVASTVTIALLLINTIRASRQNPQISLSNYPTAARCRCCREHELAVPSPYRQ